MTSGICAVILMLAVGVAEAVGPASGAALTDGSGNLGLADSCGAIDVCDFWGLLGALARGFLAFVVL